MRYRRAGLFAAAVAGLGTVTALAVAQTPPAATPPASVTPVQPGVMAPTSWRPAPNGSAAPAAIPPSRPAYFQPSEPTGVVPVRGAGPATGGVVQAAAVQLPPPTIPAPGDKSPPTIPSPAFPVGSPSALPPSITPGPKLAVDGSANAPTVPVPGPASAESGPKPLVPGTTATPLSPANVPMPDLPAPVATAGPSTTGVAGTLPAKQSPVIALETIVPDAVTAGADFSYEIVVRNDGTTSVWGVRVEDDLPPGAKLIASDPAPERNGPRMGWTVGLLEPGTTRKVKVTLRPAEEGEVRSRATVSFSTGVEAKVRVTRPKLAVELAGGETARAGEPTTFQIKVTNSGTGPANNLILQARLSDGLAHAGGSVLELKLPALPAGQTKTFPLKVTAAKPGPQTCGVIVAADGTNPESARYAVAVVEPKLTSRHVGPTRCLVKSEPVYLIEMTNPGTAATDPLAVSTVVPAGFEFAQASDGGTFNATTREITWRLTALEPGKGKAVSLKLKSVTPCDGVLKTVVRTVAAAEQPGEGVQPAAGVARGLEVKVETALKAEGVPALRFEVVDVEDPVEVGKEAMYEIKVINQGTGPCTNVVVQAAPADGTAVTAATGTTTPRAQGVGVTFDPIVKLDVKGEAVYRVRVKGSVAGEHKFKVQVSSDQIKTPITKEENTRFYKE